MIVTVAALGRNMFSKAAQCMESIYAQQVPEGWVMRQFYADDASDTDRPPHDWYADYKQMQRIGGMANLVASFNMHEKVQGEPDVMVVVGADDLLLPGAIKSICDAHDAGAWVTYGNYRATDGSKSRCAAYNKDVRNERFVAMPPLSFRYDLWKKIRPQDLKMNGFWQVSSADVAYMLPMMEMAGLDRVKFIEDVIYEYTVHIQNEGTADKYMQDFCYWYSRNRPRYQRLDHLSDQPIILENEPTTSIGLIFVPRSASWPASRGAIEVDGLEVVNGALRLPIMENEHAKVLRDRDSDRVDDVSRDVEHKPGVLAGVDQGHRDLPGDGGQHHHGGALGEDGPGDAQADASVQTGDPADQGALLDGHAGGESEGLVPEGRYAGLKGMRLMLGLPIYSSPETGFMFSLLKLVMALKTVGVDITMCHSQDSLITRGRNRIANAFIESECTDLLFLDADLQFEPDSALELLRTPHDFIGCVYPMKSVDFDAVVAAHKAGRKDYVRAAGTYVVNWKLDSPDANLTPLGGNQVQATVNVVEGCARVHDVGTGFLRIRRSVLEKLKEHVETYSDDMIGSKGKILYDFFNTFIEDGTRRFLSEDYALCRRWQKIGGDVYAFVDAELAHIGKFTHQGDVRSILTKKE